MTGGIWVVTGQMFYPKRWTGIFVNTLPCNSILWYEFHKNCCMMCQIYVTSRLNNMSLKFLSIKFNRHSVPCLIQDVFCNYHKVIEETTNYKLCQSRLLVKFLFGMYVNTDNCWGKRIGFLQSRVFWLIHDVKQCWSDSRTRVKYSSMAQMSDLYYILWHIQI